MDSLFQRWDIHSALREKTVIKQSGYRRVGNFASCLLKARGGSCFLNIMKGSRKNIQGRRFGRLIVVEYTENSHWKCMCDCGNTHITQRYALEKGQCRSCGCIMRENQFAFKHGHSRHSGGQKIRSRTWLSWSAMRQRCNDPKANNYEDYGGRGITVSKEWDGPYCKSNCRWETLKQQANNKRNNHRISLSFTITQWANILGVSPHLVYGRLIHGWSDCEALFTPKHKRKSTLPH